MRAIIEDPNCKLSAHILTSGDYTEAKLGRIREKVISNIRSFFKWENYPKEYTHLLYYAELDGTAHIYSNGFIMTDAEFDREVAMRSGIGFVGAFHRR